MKVLHVNEHLAYKGGVETYLFGLLPHLERCGMTPVVAYAEGNPELYERTVHVPPIGTAGFQAESQARRQIDTVLQEKAPDLVHIHNVQNIGVLQASFNYGPTIVTTHDYRWVCPANSFFHRRPQAICERTCGPGCFTTTLTKHCVTPRPQYAAYFYRRAQWAIRHASEFERVIAPSSGARRKYAASGFHEASMGVLPYFSEIEVAEAPRPVPDRHTITYLGRIASNKGHEYFVEALGLLPNSVHGVMVGSISEAAAKSLRQLAAKHGCTERLELHGWASRSEVLDLMDRTSVFIFPSLWPETLGIVGVEALSRGVPVVASDVGGVREWCHDGETGYVVPPKDAAAIADRVQRLIGDDQILKTFGKRGLELIRNRFLPHQHVNQLVSWYQNAVSAAPASEGINV